MIIRLKFIASLAILTSCLVGFTILHEFYVSLTELRYNAGSSRLEVSMRIFPDDLDRALNVAYGLETHLTTKLEPSPADSLLGIYLRHHFRVQVNGAEVTFSYLGKEPEANAIWCYLESEPIRSPRILKVRNTILMEEFEDQVNIIQAYAGDWNKGLLLTLSTPEDELQVGED
jgi:hypothetical protein